MNLNNLQNTFVDSCFIFDTSSTESSTKVFSLECNSTDFKNLYREIIANYISNEKPKEGFRKKKILTCELNDEMIASYESQKYNESLSIKEKIENDIISFIVNNKILNNFDNKKIGNPENTLMKRDEKSMIYSIVFDVFEGPNEIDLEKLIIDEIKFDENQISEDETNKIQQEILSQKYKQEITDPNFKISDELKDRNINLILDFDGKLIFGKKRVKFKGGSAKDFEMELFKGKMLPEFEANLLGLKIGGTKTFVIQFPENYSKGLSKENAEFTVHLKKAFETKPYESVEKYLEENKKTNEEFQSEIIKLISEDIKFKKDTIEKDQLFEKLNELFINMPLPSLMIKREFKVAKENYENKKKRIEEDKVNHVHNEHCNHENDEKFVELSDEELMEIVKTKVKLMILISVIAEKNNITPNKVDLMGEIFFQAKMAKMDPFEALKYFQENNQANEYLYKTALEKKVVQFCLSKASRIEKKLSLEEIDNLYKKILEE